MYLYLHQHSAELWAQQNKIGSEIVNEVADLRQAVLLLGDQLETLKKQIKLKCDWNISSYCIAPLKFNESKYDWEKVKIHLLGCPNSSQMADDLQQEIKDTFGISCLMYLG